MMNLKKLLDAYKHILIYNHHHMKKKQHYKIIIKRLFVYIYINQSLSIFYH